MSKGFKHHLFSMPKRILGAKLLDHPSLSPIQYAHHYPSLSFALKTRYLISIGVEPLWDFDILEYNIIDKLSKIIFICLEIDMSFEVLKCSSTKRIGLLHNIRQTLNNIFPCNGVTSYCKHIINVMTTRKTKLNHNDTNQHNILIVEDISSFLVTYQ